MAYTTHIQQVLAYLKQGNKILPPVGTVLPQPPLTVASAVPIPTSGTMPTVNPKQIK